ncbi:MAG TPA: chloride channel protein [Pirellulales bacterium]|jgi:H+/Cl- antiporter ClcA|nr:chloride channel protein [Pirellulales bacterium]
MEHSSPHSPAPDSNGGATHFASDNRGDFTAGLGLVWLSILAIPVGALCAVVALVLQRLIALFTNIFYYQSFSIPEHLISPAENHLGWLAIFVPAVGGLIIGLMARFGSERIRGHGIPEALEAILIGRSRMSPTVAVLKPLSSAISIGSGGPFGAEGPIIMTGGACGSIIAQIFRMTSVERKTLLVAGAAGGMAATFGTPIAAVLLAVELLLFEWKPRSFVPVALASAAASVLRPYLDLGNAPLFTVPARLEVPGLSSMPSALIVGISAGIVSLILTRAVYLAEDAFQHVPTHWMWWPTLGGLAVGIGGYFEPRALGVGYDIIEQLLRGDYVRHELLALLIVKGLIWAIALGSGTSGGVLAPLLIMGGIVGALEAPWLTGGDARLWPLVSMAAVMGGTMRSPLTGVLFALELTYDIRVLPPLFVAAVVAHAFTVLVMKRSILTEKVARRGFHISREYGIDPLERLSVGEVMGSPVVAIPASLPLTEVMRRYFVGGGPDRHPGYPVVDGAGDLVGLITRSDLLEEWLTLLLSSGDGLQQQPIIAFDLINRPPITVNVWEPCRTAAERMAQAHVGRLAVLSGDEPSKLVGIITRSDLLKAHAKQADEEGQRERFFKAPFIGGRAEAKSAE